MFEKLEGPILLAVIAIGAYFFAKKARAAAGTTNPSASPYGKGDIVSSSPLEGLLPSHYSGGPVVNPVTTPGSPAQTTGPVRFTPAQPVRTPISIKVGTPGMSPVYSYIPTRYLPGGTYYGLNTRQRPVV